MKYTLSLIAGVVCIVTLVLPAHSQSTGTLVDRMYDNGLTIYQTPEDFKLDQFVTRGEIAKFFNQYATTIDLEKQISLSQCQFSDIQNYDTTLIPHIIEACEYGLIKGFDGKYFPNQLITEAEALTVVIRSILGVQNESGTPRRTSSYTIAQNLGITSRDKASDLDTPSTRGTIGKRLYTISNEYIPASQDKSMTDIYRSSISSGESNDAGIYVTLFDGTKTKVVEATPFTTTNFSEVATYLQGTVSPDSRFLAIDGNGFEDPFVQFYDPSTTLVHGKISGSFKDWTPNGLARIEICYNSTGICETRTSISSDTPWIFPEVRAEGGDLGFVCYTSSQLPSNQDYLALNIHGKLHDIKMVNSCRGLHPDMYSTHSIPEDALLGIYSLNNGNGEYFYTTKTSDTYEVYSSGIRSEDDSSEYQYSRIESYSLK